MLGVPVQNEWKGWVWKSFAMAVVGSEWHWPVTAMAGGPDWFLSEEQCVLCSCKDAFSGQHSQSCVLCPSINRWDSSTDQLVPLLSRFCRHLTSASLLRLYLVSAKWGPMDTSEVQTGYWALCGEMQPLPVEAGPPLLQSWPSTHSSSFPPDPAEGSDKH